MTSLVENNVPDGAQDGAHGRRAQDGAHRMARTDGAHGRRAPDGAPDGVPDGSNNSKSHKTMFENLLAVIMKFSDYSII